MATKKSAIPSDEKFEKQELDLFGALGALDKKDYGYYSRLTEEQKKKFSHYMMTNWMSMVDSRNSELQGYYVRATDEAANKHMFNENIQRHPELQWLMLCAASPNMGGQRRKWIPHLSPKVALLKETPKAKEVKEYYSKIYPGTKDSDLAMISEVFVTEHKKKVYLANIYPLMKQSDIELLAQMVTDEDIEQYERDRGN